MVGKTADTLGTVAPKHTFLVVITFFITTHCTKKSPLHFKMPWLRGKIINLIQSQHIHLFNIMCDEMGSNYEALLLQTKILKMWLFELWAKLVILIEVFLLETTIGSYGKKHSHFQAHLYITFITKLSYSGGCHSPSEITPYSLLKHFEYLIQPFGQC